MKNSLESGFLNLMAYKILPYTGLEKRSMWQPDNERKPSMFAFQSNP